MGDTEILNISPSDIAKGKFGKGAPEKNQGKRQGKRESYESRIPALAAHANSLRQTLKNIATQGGELPFSDAIGVRDAVLTLQQTIDKWGPSKRSEGSEQRKERLLDDVSALYASVNQTLNDYGISAPPKEEERHTKILQRAADSSAKLPAQDPSSSGLTPIFDEPAPTGDESSDLIPQPDPAASGANLDALPEADAPDGSIPEGVDPLPEAGDMIKKVKMPEPFEGKATTVGVERPRGEANPSELEPLAVEQDQDTREPLSKEGCPTLDILFTAFGCTGDAKDTDALKARIRKIYMENGQVPHQLQAVKGELLDEINKLGNRIQVVRDEKDKVIEEAVRKLDTMCKNYEAQGPVLDALNRRLCDQTNRITGVEENAEQRTKANAQAIEDANRAIEDAKGEINNDVQAKIAAAKQELEMHLTDAEGRLREEQEDAFIEEREETERRITSYRNKSLALGLVGAVATGIITYVAAVAGIDGKVKAVEDNVKNNKTAIEAVDAAYKKADKELSDKVGQADESLAQRIEQGDSETLEKSRSYADERVDAARQQAEEAANNYTEAKVTEVREFVKEQAEKTEQRANERATAEDMRFAAILRAHVTQEIERIDISDKLELNTQQEVIDFLRSDYFAELIRHYDENKDGGAFAKRNAQRSRTLIIKGMQKGYSAEERQAVMEYLDR